MRINTKCSIALHCLILISEFGDTAKVTSQLLAQSTGCNAAAIRSILNVLQRANIISIARGVGGAQLVCDTSTLTIWDIYSILEPDGLDKFIGYHPKPNPQCPVGKSIKSVLHNSYSDIGIVVKQKMQEISLHKLIEDYHKYNNGVIFNEQ